MQFDGALIREQGVTFAIIVVKQHVLNSPHERDQMQQFGMQVFGPIPIILMAQDTRGIPTYYGRQDIVNFLSRVNPAAIPWKRYTV